MMTDQPSSRLLDSGKSMHLAGEPRIAPRPPLRFSPWWRVLPPVVLLATLVLLTWLGTWLVYAAASRSGVTRIGRSTPLAAAERVTGEAPFDFETWWEQRTERDGAAAWMRAEALAQSAAGLVGAVAEDRRIPFLGLGHRPTRAMLDGEDSWPNADSVAEFLTWCQTALDQLELASHSTQPFWHPLSFQGFGTLLPMVQQSRTVLRLLSLECVDAMYRQDAVRVERSMRWMRSYIAASDWQLWFVGDLVHLALRGVYYAQLQSLLDSPVGQRFDPQQLAAMLLPQDDPMSRMETTSQLEKASAIWSVRSGQWPPTPIDFAGLPWGRASLAAELERHWNFSFTGTLSEAVEQSLLQESQAAGDSWILASLLPAYSAMFRAFMRDDDQQRLAEVAIGLARYQRQLGEWPAGLEQLERAGVAPDRWLNNAGHRFGYRIIDGNAWVWGTDWISLLSSQQPAEAVWSPAADPPQWPPVRPQTGAAEESEVGMSGLDIDAAERAHDEDPEEMPMHLFIIRPGGSI